MRTLARTILVALVVVGLLVAVGGTAWADHHRPSISFGRGPSFGYRPMGPTWHRPFVPFGGYGYRVGIWSMPIVVPAPVYVAPPVYYTPTYYQSPYTGVRVISTPVYTPAPVYVVPPVYVAPPPVYYPATGGIRISVSW